VTTVSTTQPEVTSPETESEVEVEAAPAEFRRRLLEGMAAAIRECGFRDSTVADVVRHARTSRRTFYEHFPSKQACFIALLQESNAAMVRQIAAAVDPGARWNAQVRQGVAPPSRQLAILLLGGLRELIATTVEDGGDIADITEVAVRATQALLGPRR
jgi:AcrR family transcriptional regulator